MHSDNLGNVTVRCGTLVVRDRTTCLLTVWTKGKRHRACVGAFPPLSGLREQKQAKEERKKKG